MTENEAIEVLKDFGKQVSVKADGAYQSTIGEKACNVAIKALKEIQKYRKIEKDLKENYHANVDIPLLMKHFIETVFKGEKHDGFCILTNEDKEEWEEYRTIGTPEELKAAMKYVYLAKKHGTVGQVIENCVKYEEIGTPEECRAAKCTPTAYDPDKVVEQLEKLKSLVPVNRVLDDIVNDKPKELGMLIAYGKAIEIVKAGGVDGN